MAEIGIKQQSLAHYELSQN